MSALEFRLGTHRFRASNTPIIEVWHDGEFIAEVTPGDGPALRVLSKYQLATQHYTNGFPNVVEVLVNLPRERR